MPGKRGTQLQTPQQAASTRTSHLSTTTGGTTSVPTHRTGYKRADVSTTATATNETRTTENSSGEAHAGGPAPKETPSTENSSDQAGAGAPAREQLAANANPLAAMTVKVTPAPTSLSKSLWNTISIVDIEDGRNLKKVHIIEFEGSIVTIPEKLVELMTAPRDGPAF